MSTGEQISRIRKYVGQLKDESKLAHALSRLDRIEMSLDLLQATGVGKEVNRLRNHPELGLKAQKIVEKWRKLARDQTESEQQQKQEETESSSSRKRQLSENEEISGKQMSFAEALAVSVPVQPKKSRMIIKETKTESESNSIKYNSSNSLPTIKPPEKKEDDVDPAAFSVRKGKPMKVYAGRKQNKVVKMDTLFNLCMTVCMQNIDLYTHGPLPTVVDVIAPVLARCTPEQLERIEYHNPNFEEDTDDLWKGHCLKAFPNAKKTKDFDETWKECYKRNIEERERRLQQISKKIKKETRVETSKTTQLADAIAPNNIRRRQENNGTFLSAHRIPSALEISKARKQIYYNGSKADVDALPPVIRHGGTPGSSFKMSKSQPVPVSGPKRGALMQKTLKMMKGRLRR